MNNSVFTYPDNIVVGQQKRSDTYTGKLGYVIYKDKSGVLRKEKSWQSWRDKSIEPLTFDNVPTEGFVLNRNGGGKNYGWHSRSAFIRVYDPRDFEFEISVDNLLFILKHADCSRGKGLEGKFVYVWSGKDLVLLPEECQEYKDSVRLNNYKKTTIKKKDLVPGHTFLTNKLEEVVYLGEFNWTEIPYTYYLSYNRTNQKDYNYFLEQFNPPKNNQSVFTKNVDGKYTFFTLTKQKLSTKISDEITPNYADIVDQYVKSGNCNYQHFTNGMYRIKTVADYKNKIREIDISKEGWHHPPSENYDYNNCVVIEKTNDELYITKIIGKDWVQIEPTEEKYKDYKKYILDTIKIKRLKKLTITDEGAKLEDCQPNEEVIPYSQVDNKEFYA